MRISTNTYFDTNVSMLDQQQSNLLNTQQQISSGKSILTPADNPTGAAQALQVSQSDATSNQYTANIGVATDAQSLTEGTLQSVTSLLQNIQTTAVNAGDASLTNADRQSLAQSLQSQLDQLVSLANSTDSVGNFLFSGFKGSTQPFTNTPNGVQYNGDNGQRMVQVTANSQLPISSSGADIFMNVKNGNGTFATQAVAGNSGTGAISTGAVTNAALYKGNSYQIQFTSATTYDVVDTTNGLPGVPAVDNSQAPPVTLTGMTFTSGQSISFNGVQFTIQGAPTSGDQFTVAPSTNENMFTTLSNLVNTLNTGFTAGDVAGSTQYSAGVNTAISQLNNDLNSVLSARAVLGANMNEGTALTDLQSGLDLQYKQTLSNLQDVDYSKAITNLTQEQTVLTATQKSFLQVQNLSIFNYIQ
jgi:flagellar hook-associated protein 3 FlgL